MNYFTGQAHLPSGHLVQALAAELQHLDLPQQSEFAQLARARAPAPTSRIHNFFMTSLVLHSFGIFPEVSVLGRIVAYKLGYRSFLKALGAIFQRALKRELK